MPTRERKAEYFKKMTTLLDTYPRILIVLVDHVGSQQLHMIRSSLRNKGEILMGKNTLMRKCVNAFIKAHDGHVVENLLPHLRGNIGLIFTTQDFAVIRKVMSENRVPAAAKTGGIAECDVIVPPGPTGCDPGQTSWFQALNVPTKISKGQIEIVSELKLVNKGEKVLASEAALLQKLNIKPFTYGLILQMIYDSGNVFEPKVLDLSEADLLAKFSLSLRRFAAFSLGANIPTTVSVPHIIGRATKRLIAISAGLNCEYSFEAMSKWKDLLTMDPEELKKLQATATSSAAAEGKESKAEGGKAKAEEKKEEVQEVALGSGDLFGGKDGY